jgi:hypothetical protein
MTSEELHQLLPSHNSDLDRAHAIVALGYPAIEPILPQLLQSLADVNWPICQALLPLFRSIGAPLAHHVAPIIVGNDSRWAYCTMMDVVLESPPLAAALVPQLQELANAAAEQWIESRTPGEMDPQDGKELIEMAQEALALVVSKG